MQTTVFQENPAHNLFSRVLRAGSILSILGLTFRFANPPQNSWKIISQNIGTAISSCRGKPACLSFHSPLLMHVIKGFSDTTSRTSFPMRYIRWEKKGVRTRDLRLSENPAMYWMATLGHTGRRGRERGGRKTLPRLKQCQCFPHYLGWWSYLNYDISVTKFKIGMHCVRVVVQ